MLYEPSSLAMTIHLLAESLRQEYDIDPVPVFAGVGIVLLGVIFSKLVTPLISKMKMPRILGCPMKI